MKRKRTIQDEAGCVIVHLALPPHLMRWASKHAKDRGHGDIQVVLREGIGLLMAKQKAGLPLA